MRIAAWPRALRWKSPRCSVHLPAEPIHEVSQERRDVLGAFAQGWQVGDTELNSRAASM
jgi:hypothetical protein